MPMPSKFAGARRRVILELLSAAASRRAAAKAAGVDHSTLSRWLRFAETASRKGAGPSSWRTCGAPRRRPSSAGCRRPGTDPIQAWKFLEGVEFGPDPEPAPPTTIYLAFGPDDDHPGA